MEYIFHRCVNRECTLKDICFRYQEGEPAPGDNVEVFDFDPVKKHCVRFIFDLEKSSVKQYAYNA